MHALTGSSTFDITVMQKSVADMGWVLLAPIEWKQSSKNMNVVAEMKLYYTFQVLIIPFVMCIIRNWLWKIASWLGHKIREHISQKSWGITREWIYSLNIGTSLFNTFLIKERKKNALNNKKMMLGRACKTTHKP